MSDKLEIFIDKHLQEFDTIEPANTMWANIDTRVKIKSANSKLLSKFIYFSLSSIVVVCTVIYFVLPEQKNKPSIIPHEKQKEVLKDTVITDAPKENSNVKDLKQYPTTSPISQNQIEKKEIKLLTVSENTILPKQDTPKAKQEKPLVDIMGVERGIFYHIGYNGGPINHKKSHFLGWYTHKQLPNTYFIVEHFIWNKWVQRGKVIPKSSLGRPQHSGQIIGKYAYALKVPPHSGQNKWRVLLMNDSNVCIGVSKELDGVDDKGEPLHLSPKVRYTNKKDQEILFSTQTYYELHDASGKIVDEGMGLSFLYGAVEPGIYTLYYDNSIETIKLK